MDNVVVLLLLPQRYIFSSKSQPSNGESANILCCCCYHKGTYFQANHNKAGTTYFYFLVVVATTKVHIFKQITTISKNEKELKELLLLPQRYIFSSKSQPTRPVNTCAAGLLLLPQRYIFSSKSQRDQRWAIREWSCCCYHKGTYFQANHNSIVSRASGCDVVVATTKVHIFKQITTVHAATHCCNVLLLLPQRYIFSSKSQRFCRFHYH